MAELEVDQSNLPKVQDVCQCFAVLEDGVLAHSLQEQEIEQYYSSNVQRNQLVQRDIRVAKRLQDEEERRRQMLQHQATRQLEERDSEYARMIQEDIQRRAEEARMREVEDEEIAKRIQEEEELCMRRRGSYQNRDDRETPHVPPPPYSHRPVHTPHTEDQYYIRSSTRRWQHPPSPTYSDSEEDLIEHNRPRAQTNRTQTYQDFRPNVGQRNVVCYSTTPRAHLEQDCRSTTSQSSSAVSQTSRTSHLSGGWGGVIQLIKNDMSEQGYLDHSSEDEFFEPVYKLERILRQKQEVSDQRSSRGGRLSRHSSVREELSRTWQGEVSGRRESFRGNDRERRVHFLDERRRPNSYHGNGYRVHENGHSDARERGEVAGLLTAALYRDNNVHSRVGQAGQPQTQDQGFRRNISMRRSYHGDVRLNKRASVREGSRTCSQDDSNLVNGARPSNNTRLLESRVPQVMEEEDDGRGRLREAGRSEMEVRGRGRSQRQRTRSLTEEERRLDRDFRRYRGEHRVRRSQSERWQSFEEEEEEVESRREERWMQRLPSPRSMNQSFSGRSPGAEPAQRSGTAALDLGDLEQVLQDEELARRLQKEEERLAEVTRHGSSPVTRTCPVEDFRIAQVAQDEEIARFMQKEEVKAKRRSHELDPAEPELEHREMLNMYDGRDVQNRQVQRDRLDSQGLQSPIEDFISDRQPPSPIPTTAQLQPIRNIAEELDPTFQRKETTETGQTINGPDQNQVTQQVGLYNPMEETTFVPPTKRQSEKLGRVKSKEKKENTKQKENCKQQ